MKILTSAILSVALSACAMTGIDKARGPKEAAQVASLLGVWESPCAFFESGYRKTQRIFSAESVEIRNLSFASPECAGEPFQVMAIQAAYAIGDGNPGNVTPIDIQYAAAALTVNDAARVTSYNAQRLYERDDWVVGMAMDVLDRPPAPGQLPTVKKGEVVYALFQLIDGKLYHADFSTGDGTSPATRPTRVRSGVGDLKVN